ncbi:CWF19-like protein 1, related [Eimeria necatrix]|uniref:CWF19-like protein 1, related n=1 Tax=Eimeria necatrix TaxID=51315 RepID=U6MKB1_9EIME|nr:CWF19-like protein 1, related [Eimeria necatrix]CDJ62065.1 CWF19-like protein 1, related [Eimeria necatrix]
MRLISLGVVGEKGPQVKAFHALQLRPTTAMLDLLKQQEKQQQGESEGASRGFKQEQQQQQAAAAADAVEEARAALFFVPIECNSPNPFICAVRQRQLLLHSPPPQEMWAPVAPGGPSPSAAGGLQGPPRAPKRPRETGVVLVENLPFELTEEGPLKKALERFGAIKFIFMPKDKTDPTKGTGKAYVVYFDPKDAASATEASGQLEGGGRPLRLRLYYDKIPFDRPTGAKSIKCGSVIATEPHADCWFCLANPQVEKHMIVDIADRMYTAVPKGGLTPLHMLLIPIAHLPSLAYADAETRREAAALIRAARSAFRQQSLDLVVYERYVPMKATKAMHSQLHAIPCDRSQALQSGELFEKRAKRAGLSLQRLPETADITSLSELAKDPCLGYFYVEIPGVLTAKGQTIDRYLHVQPGRDSGKIPMTFGREVMAELLGLRDKVNWQACLVPKDEEAKLAAALRDVVGVN